MLLGFYMGLSKQDLMILRKLPFPMLAGPSRRSLLGHSWSPRLASAAGIPSHALL